MHLPIELPALVQIIRLFIYCQTQSFIYLLLNSFIYLFSLFGYTNSFMYLMNIYLILLNSFVYVSTVKLIRLCIYC